MRAVLVSIALTEQDRDVLDHEQDGRIKEALLRITQLLDRRLMPRRTRALIGKLRYLTETNADEEIRDKAQALLPRLS